MIGFEDADFTFEYDDYFKILPNIFDWAKDKKRIKDGKKVSPDFTYSSDNNLDWMSKKELKIWIKDNYETNGQI